MQVVVTILRAPTLHRDGEKPFIVYDIEAAVKSGADVVYRVRVLRRYSDFRKLAKSLLRNGMPAIDIPGKLLFSTTSALEARKVALQESLNEYCAKIIAKNNRLDYPLSTFLGLHEYFRLPGQGNTSASRDNSLLLDMSSEMTRTSVAGSFDQSTVSTQECIAVTESFTQTEFIKSETVSANSEDSPINTQTPASPNESAIAVEEYEIDVANLHMVANEVATANSRRVVGIRRFGVLCLFAGFAILRVPTPIAMIPRIAATFFAFGASFGSLLASRYFSYFMFIAPADIPMKKKELPPPKQERIKNLESPVVTLQAIEKRFAKSPINMKPIDEDGKDADDENVSTPTNTEPAVTSSVSQPNGLLDDIQYIDQNFTESRHRECFSVTKAALAKINTDHPQYKELSWRYARCVFYIAPTIESQEKLEMIQGALKILEDTPGPLSSEIHKYLALLKNMHGEMGGTKERIANAYEYERHTKEAIKINPDDPTLYFMLGRFCFGVAQLSWFERKAAATVFGKAPPKSTYEEALGHFNTCVSKRPNQSPLVMDLLWIAKCQKEMGNKKEAINTLRKALSKDTSQDTQFDVEARKEATDMLGVLL